MDGASKLTIGQLARRFGLNTSAIRYYERIALPSRTARAASAATARTRSGAWRSSRSPSAPASRSTRRACCSDGPIRAHRHSRPSASSPHERRNRSLIERAQAMRSWMLTASDCSCTTLDVCALFEAGDAPEPLRISHVDAAAH